VTAERVAREIAEHYGFSDDDCVEYIAKKLAAYAATERQQWVACSERLPEKKGKYLVSRQAGKYDDPRTEIQWWTHVDDPWRRGFYSDGEQDTNVTHWMELPEREVQPSAATTKEK